VPLAGNVTFGDRVLLQCPLGTNFLDTFQGLYGPQGSYPVPSTLCNSSQATTSQVLGSTLEFVCNVCGVGLYTVFRGSSTGAPGAYDNHPCLPCPRGALCTDGAVNATAGYWGAADTSGVVALTVCPDGYCCDGWACAGGRVGLLCADCSPGMAVGLGTARCIWESRCRADKVVVWPLLVALVVVAAWCS
jgi:hypothetical protein